jgi:hypothetical protein
VGGLADSVQARCSLHWPARTLATYCIATAEGEGLPDTLPASVKALKPLPPVLRGGHWAGVDVPDLVSILLDGAV